jgi:hypothetical protein
MSSPFQKPAVLLFQEQKSAHAVDARIEAHRVEAHDRDQRVRLRQREARLKHSDGRLASAGQAEDE